ncbi:MAG: hypothetical protein H0X16_07130 [Chloroflexi bacterium]|nr:hypothetical protein [Chloroflexota bacterium]
MSRARGGLAALVPVLLMGCAGGDAPAPPEIARAVPEARQSLIHNLDAVDGARYTDAEQLPCTGMTILYFDLSGPRLLATDEGFAVTKEPLGGESTPAARSWAGGHMDGPREQDIEIQSMRAEEQPCVTGGD